jgi:hypothetical protein
MEQDFFRVFRDFVLFARKALFNENLKKRAWKNNVK